MPTPAEYQAAAIAAVTTPTPTEAPAPPPAETAPEAPPAEAPVEAAKPPEPAKAAEVPPASLAALAREKASMRKQQQELTARLERADPALKAAEAGDPIGVLTALGFSYTDIIKQATEGTKAVAKAREAPKPDALAEIQSLKQMLVAERETAAREKMTSQAQALISKDAAKFKYLSSPAAARVFKAPPVDVAVKWLQKHHADTGEMPGATLEQSIQVALEALEEELAEHVETWGAFLTKPAAAATVSSVAPKEAASQATSDQATQSKTLNNSQVAPRSPTTDNRPRTEEDYRRDALALFSGQ